MPIFASDGSLRVFMDDPYQGGDVASDGSVRVTYQGTSGLRDSSGSYRVTDWDGVSKGLYAPDGSLWVVDATQDGDTGLYNSSGVLRATGLIPYVPPDEDGEPTAPTYITNPDGLGAEVPSTAPTNWGIEATGSILWEIVEQGVVNNTPYTDIRFYGPAVEGDNWRIYLETGNEIRAYTNMDYGLFLQLAFVGLPYVSGTLQLVANVVDNTTAYIETTGIMSDFAWFPNETLQEFGDHVIISTDPDAAIVYPFVYGYIYTPGDIDFTIRVARVQAYEYSSTPVTAEFFSPLSNWNTPLGSSPLISPNSAGMIERLKEIKGPTEDWQLNIGQWGPNLAWAPADAPRTFAANADWRIDDVPWVEDAVGSPDTDGHCAIIDESRGLIYNFYQLQRVSGHYTCGALGVFRLDGPGWYNPNMGGPWTGRSANSCLVAGTILPDELRSGRIPHAISFGLDGAGMDQLPALPAYTTDPGNPPGGVPNGSRIQLDPSYDVDGSSAGDEAKVILKALQEFGGFIVERTSGFALYFQCTANGNASYAGMDFSGLNGAIFDYCRIIAPAASYEYDYPSRFSPSQPYPI